MRSTGDGRAAGLFTALLLISTVGAGVTIQPAAATDVAVSVGPTDDDTITQTQRYALVPNETGDISVTLVYEIPDRVTRLRTIIPADATVTDTDGFTQVNDTSLRWDESTRRATATLRYNPNRTTEQTGLEAAPGRYLFADAGSWALVRRVQTPTEWSYTESGDDRVAFQRQLRTAGAGYAADEIVYLGDSTTVERTAHGQTFRLIVPERADLEEQPADILQSLTAASGSFQVGDRDEEVVAFAAPTGRVEWGVRGLELGGSEFWVRDSEPLETPSNVWLHEYVHTRQGFTTTSETRWVTEGTAVYYAAMLALEQGRIDFEQFRQLLANGERSRYAGVALADESTWTANAHYVKGPLVAGRIDQSIRAETDASASFEESMARLNDISGPVSQRQFLDAVGATGGSEARRTASTYTTTTEPVSVWNETTHTRLFGPLPAIVRYRLPTSTAGYRIDGPYRNGTIDSTPVRLATGERLTVDAVITNAGDEAGAYDAALTVDGSVVDSATGDIAADTERTVPLSYRLDRPGEYTVSVGERSVTVVVREPAEPTVANLTTDRSTVRRGSEAVVTATVDNNAAVPANGTVAFTRNGTAVAREHVRLAPGETTQLSVAVQLPTVGSVQLGAGAADPVTVTVVESTSGGSGPGFSVVATLLAVLLALSLVRRR